MTCIDVPEMSFAAQVDSVAVGTSVGTWGDVPRVPHNG
jgi:hypothetical protein